MFYFFQGLPLHVQIDTFENMKDTLPVSRAYCQIKVFCDKVRYIFLLSFFQTRPLCGLKNKCLVIDVGHMFLFLVENVSLGALRKLHVSN